MAPKIPRCARGKCRRRPRPEGRYCALCHAAANRRSHRKHHKESNARRRDRARDRGDETRARDSARAKLYVAIARGKMVKGTCVVCHRHNDVVAYIADPARWTEVVWTCREHRSKGSAATAEPRPTPVRTRWDERDEVLAAIAGLSEKERAVLYERAAQGPAAIRLEPSAPLFTIQLTHAYRRRRSGAG